MRGSLDAPDAGLGPVNLIDGDVSVTRKGRRIEIVSEVEGQWPDGSLVTHAQTHRVRNVVVAALRELVLWNRHKAALLVGLVKTANAGEHFLRLGEDVAHVMKDRESDTVMQVR